MAAKIVAALIMSVIVGAAIACSGAPAAPAQPQQAAPAQPAAPTQPTSPAEPAVPALPQPAAPSEPAAPALPAASTQPSAPAKPASPARPAGQTEPDVRSIATVTVTVTYRERIALTPDAVVEIKLIDVSRVDAPAVTIGEQVIESPGQAPISFEIEYDPSAIHERFSYAVQARITENGKLTFINDTRYGVITLGSPNNVDMVLVKVAETPTALPVPDVPNMVATPAPIESVSVTYSDSSPAQYTVQIVSGLPGGCVEFDSYTTTLRGNTVNIKVTNLAPTEPVPCTKIYGRHEGEVALGSEFTPGETYTVFVNGELTSAFTVGETDRPEAVISESPIERVEVAVSESDPAEYTLRVVSRLPLGSSCSWFNGYDITRPFDGVIEVTLTHFAVTGIMPCTEDMPFVETEIPLGIRFESGESYTVNVNGEPLETFVAR